MDVDPIRSLTPGAPAAAGGSSTPSSRRAQRRIWVQNALGGNPISRKDWNAVLQAASQVVPPAASPDVTAAAPVLAAAQAVPAATGANGLDAGNAAVLDAASVARDAATATVQAAQALAIAAGAVTAAMAAVNAAANPVAAVALDSAGLAADATAKYMGGGFLGPPAGPGSMSPSTADGIPAVGGVAAAPALAANTYSNPQDRSYGQAGAAHTAPMVPATNPAEGPELDLDA